MGEGTWGSWIGSALGVAGAGAVLASLGACGPEARGNGGEGPGDVAEAQERRGGAALAGGNPGFRRTINVEVRPVRAAEFTERIALTGTVQANRDVTVSAEETGRIDAVLVEKGSTVEAGEPILKIDDSILRAEVEQTRARAELAREMWERWQRLYEEEGVGTEQQYLEARYNAEEEAASLEMLERRLERTTIRAPVDGVLEERYVEVGTMVSPGTEVGRIVELDPVKVSGGVPERYAPDVARGTPVSVTFDVLPDSTFEGRVGYVGATVDPGSRTFGVEFTLPNPRHLIKPEMVANLSLVRRIHEDALVVPREALVRTEDGFRAFVVEEGEGEEGVARARDVALRVVQGNQAVVDEGLAEGDLLVVVGQQMVAEGDRVQVVATHDDRPLPVTAEVPAGEEGR